MKKVFIITGQTATGKTALAVEFAKKYNGELINADSRQIYRYLDIVSGKDRNLINVPIHMYDTLDPKEHFSSFDWTELAKKEILKLHGRGKTPIIIGGTYLYLKHLLYGIETTGVPADWSLRARLAKATTLELQKMLMRLNPRLFAGLNNAEKNNPQRLIRKIEIARYQSLKAKTLIFRSRRGLQTGAPQEKLMSSYDNVEFIGLRFARKESLRKALEKRVDARLEMGAIKEVKELLSKGYKIEDPGLSTNACAEIKDFIDGNTTKDQLREKWITLEMQYARRQYTFMKRDPNIKWREI